jgi:hypothetical protein
MHMTNAFIACDHGMLQHMNRIEFKDLTRRCMLINLLISTGMSTAKMKEKFSKSLRGVKSKTTSFFRV